MPRSIETQLRRLVLGLGVLFVVLASIEVAGQFSKYLKFRNLTKDDVVAGLIEYSKNESRPDGACLYVVECSSGRARLRMIKDLELWDLEETKTLIWRRRFEDFCPGRTTNIGLELLESESESIADSSRLGRWSFGSGEFLRRLSRFQSGSFSQEASWEKCAPEYAISAG